MTIGTDAVEANSDPSYLSGAKLSGVHLSLPFGRDAINQRLRAFGPFEAKLIDDYARGMHPVCFELWHVADGRLELGGMDQHDYCTRLGAAVGAALEKSSPVFQAARLAERLDARAREWSERVAFYLGDYHELSISVPNVVCAGRPAQPHTLVLGMVTDSRLARWGDTALGFGYHKQVGTFETDNLWSWRVSAGGRQLLTVNVKPGGSANPLALARLNALWRDPLLGGLGAARWVGSLLKRDLLAPEVQVAAVTGTLDLTSALALGPGAGVHALRAEASDWDPLLFRNVGARISYPWRVEGCRA
jgi:hypothetical protein